MDRRQVRKRPAAADERFTPVNATLFTYTFRRLQNAFVLYLCDLVISMSVNEEFAYSIDTGYEIERAAYI